MKLAWQQLEITHWNTCTWASIYTPWQSLKYYNSNSRIFIKHLLPSSSWSPFSISSMARLIAFLAILFFVSTAHSAPSCPAVTQQLAPCLTFVKGGIAEPSQACCNGVKDLSNNVHSNEDRHGVCLCLQQALSKIGSYEPSNLPLVPKKCGLKINLLPIDKNTDCSK